MCYAKFVLSENIYILLKLKFVQYRKEIMCILPRYIRNEINYDKSRSYL